MLSEIDSDNESVHQITINEHFAKAYARKKEREELSKLKGRYGSDAEDAEDETDDSEEDTTEDEEGEELTPAMDVAILRTLARIKGKDPAIYDSSKDVFEEEQQKVGPVAPSTLYKANKDKVRFILASHQYIYSEPKSKPLLMKQHVLNSALRSSRSPSPEANALTHVHEQAVLREETISAFHGAVPIGEASEDEDEILIPREKTMDEIEREEEEYREFLKSQVGQDIGNLIEVEKATSSSMMVEEQVIEEAKGEERSKGKRKKGKKGKDGKSKEGDHEFLMNYILNRGWIDRSAQRIPTYHEVTSSKIKKRQKSNDLDDSGNVQIIGGSDNGSDIGIVSERPEDLEDDEFDEIADNFESSYNFRFEEPDAAIIPAHPRNITSTVRREENTRKAARERKKVREEEKLLQKKEEVKRLKALKMKEIREKLELIGREGGKSADDEALAQLDLDGDWDPEAHDRQMAGIYGADSASGDEVTMEKPTWNDDIDIADIIAPEPETTRKEKKDKKKKKKKLEDDEEGVDVDDMDVDVLATKAESSAGMKRKLADEDLDELYALDFNSMVGDLPTRFKYMPVLPQSYGLTPTEILLADDNELNEYVGLRKVAAPYRKDKGRTWDANRAEKLSELRRKVGERIGRSEGALDASAGEAKKKRKGKKERQKEKSLTTLTSPGDNVADNTPTQFSLEQGEGATVLPLEGGDKVGKGTSADENRPSKKRKRKHRKAAVIEAK